VVWRAFPQPVEFGLAGGGGLLEVWLEIGDRGEGGPVG
jgi:hypothetical protein